MANWSGTARSNYVTVADMEGLRKALTPFGSIGIYPKADRAALKDGETVCLVAEDDDGGWPSFAYEEGLDEAGEPTEIEVEFSFAERVVPFLVPGEILVVKEVGAEKHRYVSGYAAAFHWDGKEARQVSLGLNDIYNLAAEEFGVGIDTITRASY